MGYYWHVSATSIFSYSWRDTCDRWSSSDGPGGDAKARSRTKKHGSLNDYVYEKVARLTSIILATAS